MYKAIGFDYGGVFVIGNTPRFSATIHDLTGIPIETLKAEYFKINYLGNIDGIPYEEVWSRVMEKLGRGDLRDEIYKMFRERDASEKFNHELLELVDRLRANHYRVGLVTNNSLEAGRKIRELGVDKHFDCFINSSEVKLQKPDPRIFELMFTQLGVPASKTIFIDDSEQSLLKSRDIGYYPILFKSNEQLLEKFDELKINYK